MIDALDVQHIQRLKHIIRRSLFARMGHQVQTEFGGPRVHALEQFGRITHLGRIQPHAQQLARARCGSFHQRFGGFNRQIAQEAHDQPALDAVALAANAKPLQQAIQHQVIVEAIVHMHLRIEENLRAAHAVLMRVLEIREHQVGEILARAQHRHQLVIQIEERLQIGELVMRLQVGQIAERQLDAVAFGQFKCQFRFQRAFDVQMELGFRQFAQRLCDIDVGHGTLFS